MDNNATILADVQKILDDAVYAPSGDNSQPWRFVWKLGRLFVYNIPTRDNPVFNYKQRGSMIAHGALLENISILAKTYGLKANIRVASSLEEPDLIAEILFTEADKENVSLSLYVKTRVTNRKPYLKDPLSEDDKSHLMDSLSDLQAIKLLMVESRESIARIASVASMAERTMLRFRPLHDSFFGSIRWSASEEKTYRSGLYIDTLELNKAKRLVFKLYSNWRMANLFNALGLPRLIAQENSQSYGQSGAFLALVSHHELDKNTFLNVGRSLQRLWLTATSLNLSIQPIGGLIYLAQRITDGDSEVSFPENIKKEILDAIKVVNDEINPKGDRILMLLRIGRSLEAPSATSSRMKPNIISQ